MLQSGEGDNTLMKMTDNISFIRNKYSKPKQLESFEVILEHNEQVPIEFEIPKVWQSIQERREPS